MLAVATLYVACTDPPNLGTEGSAGSGGTTGGTAGAGAKGGSGGTGGSNAGSGATGGSGGSSAGKGGSGAKGGSAGKGGSTTGGTGGGTTGGTDQGGEAGMSAGMAGEGGASGGVAGESMGAASGEGGAGAEAGAGSVDPVCAKAASSVGGKSIMPALPTTGVAQPSGTPGNMKVLNWAGFKGAISWTFDDNLSSVINAYPQLNAIGVPLTFYLVCSTEGSAQVWHDAHAAGHEIGNHTVNHCNADGTGCAFGGTPAVFDAGHQIDDCTAQLMSEYGLTGVYSMASPQGDTNWDSYAATRFLVNRGVWDNAGYAPNSNSDAFNLPCHISKGPDSGLPNATNSDLAAGTGGLNERTDALAASGTWKTVLMHSFGGDYGYHPMQLSEALAAITYSKQQQDAGNVWVDTVTAIGAYWRAQKAVSSVTPVTSGSDITYSWTLPEHFPPNMYLRVTVDGGTLKQCGTELTWDDHGYYEIALDAGSVTISP